MGDNVGAALPPQAQSFRSLSPGGQGSGPTPAWRSLQMVRRPRGRGLAQALPLPTAFGQSSVLEKFKVYREVGFLYSSHPFPELTCPPEESAGSCPLYLGFLGLY